MPSAIFDAPLHHVYYQLSNSALFLSGLAANKICPELLSDILINTLFLKDYK